VIVFRTCTFIYQIPRIGDSGGAFTVFKSICYLSLEGRGLPTLWSPFGLSTHLHNFQVIECDVYV